MKKILGFILLIWVFAIPLQSQITTSTTPIGYGANLPATCAVTAKAKVLFFKTGTNPGLYSCVSTNKWSPVSVNPDDFGLRFDRAKTHNVYIGKFWNTAKVYGDFWFDALVKPELNAEYVFSAGYGGLHNILFGFSGNALSGNVSNAAGNAIQTVGSGVDTVTYGEWYHIALGQYNGFLTVYLNGVPCKKFAKADGRNSLNGYEVDGYIGGSDHSNFHGIIRYVRIFEDGQSFLRPNNTVGKVFKPELSPRTYYFSDDGLTEYNAALLLDFSTPQSVIPDLSNGFEGRKHNGRRNVGQGFNQAGLDTYDIEADLPQWEAATPSLPAVSALSPAAVPVGALVFDSFNRKDVTYLFNTTLGLGQTEGGSAGVKTWQNSQNMGILTGRVFGANEGNLPVTYVDTGFSQTITSIDNAGNETNNVALYSSFNFATTTGIWAYHDTGAQRVYFYKQTNGVNTNIGNYVVGDNTTTYNFGIENTPSNRLRLWVNGVMRVDYDNSANPAFTGTQSGFNGAGFNRIDNFLVKAAS